MSSGAVVGATHAPPSSIDLPAVARSARLDWCIPLVVAANLVHVLAFAWLYPAHRLDPDLLSYFTYFRNWLIDDRVLHSVAYFTAPKTLLVFTLGALRNPSAALACTALASAALGAIVYLIARDAFGRSAAVIASGFLLLDPSKAVLTLRSSADLYLALLVFLAILLAERGRLVGAALSILLSALVKPVTLPCAAYFLIAPGTRRDRVLAALLPFAAVPLILLAHYLLLGGAFHGAQFFDEFSSMTDGEPIGPGQVVHWVLWSQLIKIRFASTATWGVLGILLWVATDPHRLTRPLLLLPLLFLAGYLVLSAVAPYPPYFRYFWLLEIWFLIFLVSGALEVARRLAPANPRLRWAAAGTVFVLLADGLIGRQLDYRREYAAPHEQSMRFAETASRVLRARRGAGETVVAPLGLLPYMMWEFPDAARAGQIDTAERLARDHLAARPDWVIDVPRMYATDTTRRWMRDVVHAGAYTVYEHDGQAALLGPIARPPALGGDR